MSSQWHFSRGTEKYGPFSWDEMLEFARKGRIVSDDLVYNDAGGEWLKADHISGLFPTVDSGNNNAEKPASKKTPLIIGTSIIAVLLIGVIIILFTRIPDRSVIDASPESPENVVAAFWAAYQAMDLIEASQYASGNFFGDRDGRVTEYDENVYVAKLHKLVYGNIDFTVDGCTVDEDIAIVNVRVSAPDLETLLEEDEELAWTFFGLFAMAMMYPEELDEREIVEVEEFFRVFEDAIRQAPKIYEEDTVILRLEEERWVITEMFGSSSI